MFVGCIVLFLSPLRLIGASVPEITALSQHGLQIGRTTTLIINGTNLLPEPRLVLPILVSDQALNPGATDGRIEIKVTLSSSVAAGIYPLRVVTANGISNWLSIGVDRLPQQPFVKDIGALPIAYYGQLGEGGILRTSLNGRRGQRFVVDVESRRLGSSLRPVVRLLDHRGAQLAWNGAQASIAGDARLDVNLPEDGRYTVELHDVLYQTPDDTFFRMKIGDLDYADQTYPLAMAQGHENPVALEPVMSSFTDALHITANDLIPGRYAVTWPEKDFLLTGARPRVFVSEHAEIQESEGESINHVSAALPVGLNGRLSVKGQLDQFLVTVSPGDKLQLEMFAQRVNSPIDGLLIVRLPDGTTIAENDDQPSSLDPMVDVTVPANVTELIVVVTDRSGRGGSEFVYRVTVRAQDSPDFRLECDFDRLQLPLDGRRAIRIGISRSHYDGPVQMQAIGLPPGIQMEGRDIPAGGELALLVFRASTTTVEPASIVIVGRAAEATSPIARFVESPSAFPQRMQRQMVVAVIPPEPVSVHWETPSSDEVVELMRGESLNAHLRFSRSAEQPGKLRVQLLTSQKPLTKKGKDPEDDKKEIDVEDTERMLRLAGKTELSEETSEVHVQVVVPEDLPIRAFDIAFEVELLGDDGETIVASNVSQVRRVEVRPPNNE